MSFVPSHFVFNAVYIAQRRFELRAVDFFFGKKLNTRNVSFSMETFCALP